MPALGSDPVAEESASLDAMILTITAHHDLGAPQPPENILASLIHPGIAFETNVSPGKARELTRWMRMRAATLRLHARRREIKRCRRDHLMTPENTYHGKNGDQCRQCRNASRRKVA